MIAFLDREDVDRALGRLDVVEVVREVLLDHRAGRTVLPEEAYLAWSTPGGGSARSICLPARVPRGVGVKIVNANPSNPDAGLPRASALVVLFDEESARPRIVMEGTAISAQRTAAVSALAITTFAADAGTLGVVGCGPLARAHLGVLVPRLPRLRRVLLYDLEPSRAEALRADLPASSRGGLAVPDLGVEVAGSAREVADGADVLALTTTAPEQYVPFAWVARCSLVVNVSLGDLCDDVFLEADRIVVDDLAMVVSDTRRPLGRLIRSGAVNRPGGPPPCVAGDLADFLEGEVPPVSGPTVVNPFGLGICDIAVAAAVAEHAAR
jgi:N-[(2S)-2-amino-2-carboxyethyl]-L-glutamate dehydrogenase